MIRRSLIGFILGAAVFGFLGILMNREIGEPAFSNLGPVGMLAMIGGTTAALVAPLLRRRGPPDDR
ncbi:MAG: hypothetical protein R3266_05975 [Gemmatimonadota bacterium]|nr:hypothetical protein [Gemmatimonadota bacterium]